MARFCARYHGAAPTPPDIAVANFRCESGAVASVTGYSRGENALRGRTWWMFMPSRVKRL